MPYLMDESAPVMMANTLLRSATRMQNKLNKKDTTLPNAHCSYIITTLPSFKDVFFTTKSYLTKFMSLTLVGYQKLACKSRPEEVREE